jgi:hypothetical protein
MERTVLGAGFASLFSFALVIATASGVSAQCAEGRVANEATQGRCCWPNQSWNPETALCTGAPACPDGRVAQGEDCVLAAGVGAAPGAGTVQVQDPNAVPTAPEGYGGQPQQQQQQAYGQYQAVPMQPVQTPPMQTVMRPRTGFIIMGSIMFGVSYSLAAAIAVEIEYGWLAIPFAGPLITMSELRSGDTAWAWIGLGVWSLVQTAGVVMLILGITLKREVQVRADLGNGRSIALQPFETEGGGGLRLFGEF